MKAAIRLVSIACASLPMLMFAACGAGNAAPGPVTTSVETQDANGAVTDEFASGQQVNFVLKVHNTSEYPLTFDVTPCVAQTGGPGASYLVVKQGTANEVAEGATAPVPCTQMATTTQPTVTIPAGETESFTFNWNQMVTGNQLVQPGKYSVVAGLICEGAVAGYCMPDFGATLSTDQLTQSYYRSGLADFTIQP